MKRLLATGSFGPQLKNKYVVDVTQTTPYRIIDRLGVILFWTAIALILVVAAVQFEHYISKRLGEIKTPQKAEASWSALKGDSDSGRGVHLNTRKIGGSI
jgi:choline-glycine betaine transporter